MHPKALQNLDGSLPFNSTWPIGHYLARLVDAQTERERDIDIFPWPLYHSRRASKILAEILQKIQRRATGSLL